MPSNSPTPLYSSNTSDAVSVVFLHHFGGSAKTWSEVIARLALSEPTLQCYAFDQRGFGDSTLDAAGCTIANYADDIAELIANREIKRCLLVGHSMGGKIALAVAARRIPAIVGLLLIAPSPPTPEPMSDVDREELRQAHSNPQIAVEVVLKASASKLSNGVQTRTVDDIGRSSTAAWAGWLDDGSRADISASTGEINIPATVLAGGQDPGMTPSLLQREIVDRISGSRLIVIPESGHLMPLDAPAAISDYVREMIKQVGLRVNDVEASKNPAKGRTKYPPGTVRELLRSDLMTEVTKNVLTQRLETDAIKRPAFFDVPTFDLLSAVCSRLIPQPVIDDAIDIAGEIDTRLAAGDGNGWRYEALPTDGESYRQGLKGIDDLAIASHGRGFCKLTAGMRDKILSAVQRGLVAGGAWQFVSPKLFFEELLAETSEVYFSSPIAQEQIGYVGMADKNGWSKIALNQLDAPEPRASELTLA